MPRGHFSHVTDVSGLSALTLALTAYAKTNVSLGLHAQVPACGPEFIILDSENLLEVAFCAVRPSAGALGKVWFPGRNAECETGFRDFLMAFSLEGCAADGWTLQRVYSHFLVYMNSHILAYEYVGHC